MRTIKKPSGLCNKPAPHPCASQLIRTRMAWIHAAHGVQALHAGMFQSQNNLISTEARTGHQRLTIAGWKLDASRKYKINTSISVALHKPLLTARHRVCLVLFVFHRHGVLSHRCVRSSVRINQKYPRLVTPGPGQKVARPSIDNFPSELGSFAIATPTQLVLVYSVHITLLSFWLARSASICNFGKSEQNSSNKGSTRTLSYIRTSP